MVNPTPLLLALVLLLGADCLQPQTPIIGIYTQDATNNLTYIAASYVKYLEMSGAQVVPLFYKSSQTALNKTLQQINGVLFPGGDQTINIKNNWTKNAEFILEFAKKQNDNGKVFPVWGTCLGHELLSYLTANFDDKMLEGVTDEAPKVNSIQVLKRDSQMFDGWQDKHFQTASTGHGVLYFSHHYAVYTRYFNSSQPLQNFWHLVSKTTSSAGQEFVSAIQAKNYPFYGMQFHPEKNLFEWRVDANRTANSVEIVQMLSNNFVRKARLSPNRYANQNDLLRELIYNYEAVIPPLTSSFQQIYVFSESE